MTQVPDGFEQTVTEGDYYEVDGQQADRPSAEEAKEEEETADQFDIGSVIGGCPDHPFWKESGLEVMEEFMVDDGHGEREYLAESLHEEDDAKERSGEKQTGRP